MRTESWQRVRKEEREGESESRVSKAVLVKFGHQTNQKVKRRIRVGDILISGFCIENFIFIVIIFKS
jgi:hypothetical protein